MSRIQPIADKVLLGLGVRGLPMPGLLEPVDCDRLAKTLELKKEGTERGRHELPRTSQAALDDVEQRVVQEITSAWTVQRDQAIGTIRALRENVARFSVATQLGQLRLAASDARARLTSARQEIKGELSRLREDWDASTAELSRFQASHRLTRSARDPGRRWTTVGLLVFLVALESLLNGTFFAKGSEFGLIGGIGIAIGISLFNVLLCFFAGLVPARYANVRSLPLRVGGALLTAAMLLGVLALHAFAAHYRDAVAAVGEERAYPAALARLLAEPWGLSDMSSWYLFGLGVVFALAAFWKGYRFDDPYPGYGPVFRRTRDAGLAYEEAYAELFDDLADVRVETVERFRTALTNLPVEAQQAESARAQIATLARRFAAHEDHLEESANSLLSVYRSANRAIRTTEAPVRFDDRWTLTPRTDLNPPGEAARPLDPTEIDTALAEIRQLHDEMLARYEALLHEADHPASLREKPG